MPAVAVSLRTFLVRLTWFCLLPLILLALGFSAQQVHRAAAESDTQAERVARDAASSIEWLLGGRLGALRILAASPLADNAARWPELHAQSRVMHEALNAYVIFSNLDGSMRFHTALPFGAALPPAPVPREATAFRLALQTGQPAIGDLFDGPIAGEPLVALAVPGMRGGSARFMMVAVLPARELHRRLQTVGRPSRWLLTLRDGTGAVIASAGARPHDDVLPTRPAHQVAVHAPAGVDGSAPWRIEVHSAREDWLLPMLRAGALLLAAVAAATAVGVIAGGWGAARLTRAMGSLSRDAPDATAPAPIFAEVDAIRARLDESAQALQLREEQLRSIFESAGEAIVVADGAQTIVMANAAAARMFGCSVDDLAGAPLARLWPPHAGDPVLAAAFGADDDSATAIRRRDVTGRRFGGEEFPASATIARLGVDRRRLYTLILHDNTERELAQRTLLASKAELEASQADLRSLISAQDGVQERERARIGRELHDELQQTLAAIALEAAALEVGHRPPTPEEVRRSTERISQLASGAIDATRHIVADLRPPLLEELGLRPALERLTAQFAEHHGVICRLDTSALAARDEGRLGPVASCLYRVTQEALNNVAKHASAQRVIVRLSSTDGGHAELTITDDGGGMAPARDGNRTFGLLGMSERVRASGGTLVMRSAPGAGTTVSVTMPIPDTDRHGIESGGVAAAR